MKQYRLQLKLFGEGFTLEVFFNDQWMIAGTLIQEPDGLKFAPTVAFSMLGVRFVCAHSDSSNEIEAFAKVIAGEVAYTLLSALAKKHTSPPNQDSLFN